jgi:tetratricopeptide (TPR) repeat protein
MYYLRKPVFLPAAVLLAVFMFVAHAHALFDSNVDKAKDFMQAGMYPQAAALLEKEINDNPTNAEAHFQLGICYVNQGNYSSADERFASAVRLEPDYGYKIGREYMKALEYSVEKEQYSLAESLSDKVVEYDPGLKKAVAEKLFKAATELISHNINSGNIITK